MLLKICLKKYFFCAALLNIAAQASSIYAPIACCRDEVAYQRAKRTEDLGKSLVAAAKIGAFEVVKYCVRQDQGVINAINGKHGDSALIWAAHNGCSDMVFCLPTMQI